MAEDDFYGVLGLNKECSPAQLRIAYKKLALKWHPDRFCASGNPKYTEEAKKKFQGIQQAYSVLSNSDKRFLYDVGVYDVNDDDDQNGMGEFLNEMATLMTQTTPSENQNETFEELQQLFDEMFQCESYSGSPCSFTPPTRSSSSSSSYIDTYNNSTGKIKAESAKFEGFCIGTGGETSRRKNTKKNHR